MSEQLLKQILEQMTSMQSEIININRELQDIKTYMATKQDIELVNDKLNKLSKDVEDHNITSINSDTILLNEIRSIREGVVFVNRKVADTELELNMMKQNAKQ